VDEEPKPGITPAFAAIFYAILAGIAWALGSLIWSLDLLVWHNWNHTTIAIDALIGAGLGLGVVAASALLDRWASWAQALTEEFRRLLGHLSTSDVFVLAIASGTAEEIFFRGFLQQILSVRVFVFTGHAEIWGLVVASIAFGLVHIGPDIKKFWPWTVMAVVMGFFLGGVYLYTGNLLAPILAHFTINFLNLSLIAQDRGEEDERRPGKS